MDLALLRFFCFFSVKMSRFSQNLIWSAYQCYPETYQNSCKEATRHQETILTALDATRTTSCKDVIQAFRDNEEIFVGLFRHAESVYGESIPMPPIVNRQANTANLLAVSPLQFFRRSVFLPFIDTVLE